MGKWSERAASLTEQPPAPASAHEPALDRQPLPAAVRAGLNRLRLANPPRLRRSEVWQVVVADALRLAMDGWAERALSLGWQPIELFGISSSFEGLAAWLDGRAILLLDDARVIVRRGDERHQYHRTSADGAVWLWDWGR